MSDLLIKAEVLTNLIRAHELLTQLHDDAHKQRPWGAPGMQDIRDTRSQVSQAKDAVLALIATEPRTTA